MAKEWVKAGMVSSVGVEFAVAVGLFSWLGRQADMKFESAPALTLAGFFIGLVVAAFSLIRTLKRIEVFDQEERAARAARVVCDVKETRGPGET